MVESGNLRVYGLASLTGLTALGWLLEKLPSEITIGVFGVLGALIGFDMYKHKTDK